METADMTGNDAAVEIAGLTVKFAGRVALREIALSVPVRSLTVVIGPSGSGKTTLLRSLNRLNECFPGCSTEGTVRIRMGGRWVDAYRDSQPVTELRRRVGMVFQTPNVLPCSIEKNLTLALLRVLGISKRDAPAHVERALRDVGLWEEVHDRLHHAATTLSGGQQQRLCLARTLVLDPEVLLLDEPTSSLDFRSARSIEQLLLRLRESYTMVAVSHSPGQTRRLADRVVVLRDGLVVKRLTREDLGEPETFQALLEDVF
jgi:phosphate transport system ATP-binding protein